MDGQKDGRIERWMHEQKDYGMGATDKHMGERRNGWKMDRWMHEQKEENRSRIYTCRMKGGRMNERMDGQKDEHEYKDRIGATDIHEGRKDEEQMEGW